jgi:ribosome-associated translation inhibitor RaiA
MEIQVRTPHASVKKGTKGYAELKIGGALEKVLGKDGSRADIEIADLSNGHGAPQMRVSVHVTIPHNKPHTVHAENAEVGAAIDLAADKILRAVKRTREKKRDRQRHSSYNLQAVPPGPIDEDDDSVQPITL